MKLLHSKNTKPLQLSDLLGHTIRGSQIPI
jgi:hypothetical protein